ncbi:MAG: hypothetical protein IBX48_09360 [Thiomicrospira sp.]|uniref:hypothetical protein n=1 Tax=Thiomicrospira sp. TaxID=935 RepID=UPI0019DD8E3F|nr:hypothetical protein [Thiomicrospira sp.]MBE0494532.1 hypothetical protein [Thiomicrospira sp.]
MLVKGLTVSVMVGALAWQTVQASSISTRVRVLENKVSQFERQVNQERAQQNNQVEQVQRNSHAIEALSVRVDEVALKLKQGGLDTEASASAKNIKRIGADNGRFTDSRYSFP